MGWLNNIEF